MFLEMSEVYEKIIIGEMTSDDIVPDVGTVLHRKPHFSFLIHKVNRRDIQETVVSDGLPMALR